MLGHVSKRLLSTSSSAVTSASTTGKFFKIKLYRGFIGLPDKYKEWARTLGLRKKGQTNHVPVMPQTMGAIIKLKELLKVEIVGEKPASNKISYPKGYEVIDDYISRPLLSNDAKNAS